MRIYLSYARADKPFVIEIADRMDVHEVWYDHRLYTGQIWWGDILKRLDWCEKFMFCLSEASINSDYCLKEWAVAQRLGKPTVPVLIAPNITIPDSLKYLEYIDFSQGMSVKELKRLLYALNE
ncbi:MAG: toll/interleukin-1 receptor domain-containing protein [Anaerolineae bacterium]|nr:toll/interleukin-1 receptor domain-containing protein [Anaerolineae bacterium]